MSEFDRIKHCGIVQSIDSDSVSVTINTSSACSACHSRSACGIEKGGTRTIIAQKPDFDINTGDQVTISISKNAGTISVVMAYVLPSVVLIAVIVASLPLGETMAALLGIASVGLYYLFLYLTKNIFKSKIVFKIER